MKDLALSQPAMPPRAPLDMVAQSFATKPALIQPTPSERASTALLRVIVFLPVLVSTLVLLAVVFDLFSLGGIGWLEGVLMALIATSFVWISLSVSTAILGAVHPKRTARPYQPPRPDQAMDVAIVMPLYEEDPAHVFGNVLAMMHELSQASTLHRFSVFVLSDTQSDGARAYEAALYERLRDLAPPRLPVYYRNRTPNTDRKSGNIADWVRGWGGGYEAMLVLDADSLMTAEAITALADAMACDPQTALVQSQPRLYRGRSLFAAMQQFGMAVYGPALARGLALWSGQSGNFWGHNAIIRTQAFAKCAALPKLTWFGRRPRLILSHDFVEAALLRRGGWRVRFLPEIDGSFEEAPESLLAFVQRDRRWCHGNLQHLRLLAIPGLHWVSRIHLISGAFSYLLSPAWFLMLGIWLMLGRDAEANPISYFSAMNPLYPNWPTEQLVASIWVLGAVYAMLLLPKLIGVALVVAHPGQRQAFGGGRWFAASVVAEVTLSILYAPILMVQQSRAVLRAVMGSQQDWLPKTASQNRLSSLLALHRIETGLGLAILLGIGFGVVSLWLLPIGVSLSLAVALSWLGSRPRPHSVLFTPHSPQERALIEQARRWRCTLGPGDCPQALVPPIDPQHHTGVLPGQQWTNADLPSSVAGSDVQGQAGMRQAVAQPR